MKRSDFLKSLGLAGAGMAVSGRSEARIQQQEQCVLIPSEAAGPFPLDLTENEFFLRQDIRENEAGVPLEIVMKVRGVGDCAALSNVRVNLWHCNKDGLYSGYDEDSNPGQGGATYLRGYQFTDAEGLVRFKTVFPGLYPGRICHIHMQIFVSTSYAAVTQITFPESAKNALYQANLEVYQIEEDPLALDDDFFFRDGYQLQLASLEKDEEEEVYRSYLEVAVDATTLGLGYQEHLNRSIFELRQNFPNPHHGQTSIPFTLKKNSLAQLEIWSTNGQKLYLRNLGNLNPGFYVENFNLSEIGLPPNNYIFQLVIENANKVYRWPKVMTAVT